MKTHRSYENLRGDKTKKAGARKRKKKVQSLKVGKPFVSIHNTVWGNDSPSDQSGRKSTKEVVGGGTFQDADWKVKVRRKTQFLGEKEGNSTCQQQESKLSEG